MVIFQHSGIISKIILVSRNFEYFIKILHLKLLNIGVKIRKRCIKSTNKIRRK